MRRLKTIQNLLKKGKGTISNRYRLESKKHLDDNGNLISTSKILYHYDAWIFHICVAPNGYVIFWDWNIVVASSRSDRDTLNNCLFFYNLSGVFIIKNSKLKYIKEEN